jgi:nicotinamidase-related amidase
VSSPQQNMPVGRQRLPEETRRFRLPSESCELLLAFERAASLAELAADLHRDVSVISKQLKSLAETEPALEKHEGRWRLTDLGRRVNRWTQSSVRSQEQVFEQYARAGFEHHPWALPAGPAALLVIGLQNGFLDPVWGPRNNLDAEKKIQQLIDHWRAAHQPIVYAQTVSRRPESPLAPHTLGSRFRDFLTVAPDDLVIENQGARSSFSDPKLDAALQEWKVENIVLVGFTVNHCIDATARAASDLHYHVYVVSDATVAFDRVGTDGENISADRVHSVVMANLSQDFATVITADELLHGPSAGIE